MDRQQNFKTCHSFIAIQIQIQEIVKILTIKKNLLI